MPLRYRIADMKTKDKLFIDSMLPLSNDGQPRVSSLAQ
jgi:hypothetical protein